MNYDDDNDDNHAKQINIVMKNITITMVMMMLSLIPAPHYAHKQSTLRR